MKRKVLVVAFMLLSAVSALAAVAASAGSRASESNLPSTETTECADCEACERQMRTIRSLHWSPGPPPEGNWCGGQASAVVYCFDNCIPCNVCIEWRDQYNQLCNPSPSPEPTPEEDLGGCGTRCDSPVLIDVLGDGFQLTNATNGVRFNLDGVGVVEQIAWTVAGSDDAWLALDRNNNGLIENGQELFGNLTHQPDSANRNGFLALAVLDSNRDGVINADDSVFEKLQLWQDKNHNGISEPDELTTLARVGITTIGLDYKESKYVDAHGNEFRYRAKVKDGNDSRVARWAWDVFLTK